MGVVIRKCVRCVTRKIDRGQFSLFAKRVFEVRRQKIAKLEISCGRRILRGGESILWIREWPSHE